MILSVIAQGGLCNRMRVMASTIELARRLNTQCWFIWVRMPDMNARFDSLFQEFPYPVIECSHRRFVMRTLELVRIHWKGTLIEDAYANLYSKKPDWKAYILKGKLVLVWTCENFLRTENFEWFKVQPSLANQSNIDWANNKTIGIHIRRTDNEMSVKYSPTHLFVERMNQAIQEENSVRFYLATDDPEEESVLVDKFPSRIITFPKQSLDRNNPVAIQEALIDLYNLAHCKRIFASYYSSFSDVAAAWGKIEKEVIKQDTDLL